MAEAGPLVGEDEATVRGRDQTELLRFLTAGSVDDGKSTLIGRLLYDTQMIYEDQLLAMRRDSTRRGGAKETVDLSLLTDGLRAEREQGITIDVAYRYFSTSKRKFIIADCPGHEQYTRNMATGASNCDLAIILVDARTGVVRQTKRHSFIVSLLGIKHVVVAVNKMDLVAYSQKVFDDIVNDYTAFATRLEIPDIRFIPVSALSGDNVVGPSSEMSWYRGETLLHYLENVHIASDRNLIDLRFPVQYVNRPSHDFRGFCGTVASGVLRKGDAVTVLPSGVKSRIKTILGFDGECEEAFPPMAVTVTLTEEVDVSRGDMFVHPANLSRLDEAFEAMIVWMDEKPLVPGKPYLFNHTTNAVTGQLSTLRYLVNVDTLGREPATALAMNEIGRCAVRLTRRICFDPYARNRATGGFIIIDRMTNRTVGAGMIVDRATSLRFLDDQWPSDSVATSPAPEAGWVTADERSARVGQTPVTLLLTGRPGSGKTTIARALERRLFDDGRSVCVLDGQRMRHRGDSAEEGVEDLRRSIDIALILNEAGLICIAAFVAPSAAVREKARQAIGTAAFLEVFVNAPEGVCERRMREASRKPAETAGAQKLPPLPVAYEPPAAPDLVLDSDKQTVDQCVDALMDLVRRRRMIP